MRLDRYCGALFGAGCALVCFGLSPFQDVVLTAEASAKSKDQANSMMVERELDEPTRVLSLAFALMGLMCVTLSWADAPRAVLRLALPMVFLPLLIVSSISAIHIYSHYTASDLLGMVSESGITPNSEAMLESRVNILYCKTAMRNVCEHNTITQVRTKIPSLQWPLHKEEKISAAQACAQDYVMRGSSNLSDVCRVCLQQPVIDSNTEIVTSLVRSCPVTTRWCGEYLMHNRMHQDRTDSPYRHHRLDLLENLRVLSANRVSSVRLLLVLDWFAIPALVALLYWWICVSTDNTPTPSAHSELTPNID